MPKDGLYCDAGSRWVCLMPNGDVRTCHFLKSEPSSAMGNIFDSSFRLYPDGSIIRCPIQKCHSMCDRHWSRKFTYNNDKLIDFEDIVLPDSYKNMVRPLSIIWTPTWKCNYQCSYCQLPEPEGERTAEEWIFALERLFELEKISGGVFHTNGGEPLYAKGAEKVLKFVSTYNFKIALTSNFSMDMYKMIVANGIPPSSFIGICASMHPSDKKWNGDLFKGKVVMLKKLGYPVILNFVAHPDQMCLVEEIHEFYTVKHNIPITFIPMADGFSGVHFQSIEDYPEALRAIIRQYSTDEHQDHNKFTDGKRLEGCNNKLIPVDSFNVIEHQTQDSYDIVNATIKHESSGDLSLNVISFSQSTKHKIDFVPMNSIRGTKKILDHSMFKELYHHIDSRTSYFGKDKLIAAEWLRNRVLAIQERNDRKINLLCKPLYLDVELNNICNLKCQFCTCVIGHVRDLKKQEAKLTIDEINKLKDLYTYAEIMETSKAGEPFLTPDLFIYLLKTVRDVNPFVVMQTVTNGTVLNNDLLKAIIEYKLDHIYISINSHDKSLFKELTLGGNFDQILKNMDAIQEKKSQYSSMEPFLHFNCQMGKYADPLKVLDIAHKYGVVECNFVKTQMFNENESYRGSSIESYMPENDLKQLFKEIVNKANKLRISINFPGWENLEHDPILGSEQYFYYPHITKYFDYSLTCPTDAPWFRFCTAMRHVQPCCWSGSFDDWTIKPFDEIWNGEYLKSLRQQLSAGKYPSVCHCRY